MNTDRQCFLSRDTSTGMYFVIPQNNISRQTLAHAKFWIESGEPMRNNVAQMACNVARAGPTTWPETVFRSYCFPFRNLFFIWLDDRRKVRAMGESLLQSKPSPWLPINVSGVSMDRFIIRQRVSITLVYFLVFVVFYTTLLDHAPPSCYMFWYLRFGSQIGPSTSWHDT
jgi:hypothetical protein